MIERRIDDAEWEVEERAYASLEMNLRAQERGNTLNTMSGMGIKRRANVMGGVFYPEDRAVMEAALDAFNLHPGKGGSARAIVAPHAGWELSGSTAAAGFAAAAGRSVSTVVIIGPIHEPKSEGLFLSDSDFFETPIGDIPVAIDLCEELETCGTSFLTNDIPHLAEHSIEILLPFVKRCFPKASIVPILFGGERPSSISALSRGMDLIFTPLEDSTLFVVSTNFSEPVDTPFSNEQAQTFQKLLLDGDREGILAAMEEKKLSACGASAAAAILGTRLLGDRPLRLVAETTGSTMEKSFRYASIAID